MNRRIRLVLGFIVSFLFLYLALRDINWAELWSVFRDANYLYLLPALLLLVIINVLRGYRWRILMYPDMSISLWRMFRFVNIGYLFNNILPAKAGEVVRGYLAGRLLDGGIGQALSSLVIERLLDVLTLVVIMMGLLPFVDLPTSWTQGAIAFGAAAVGGAVVLAILARVGQRGIDWLWRFLGKVPVLRHPKLKVAAENLVRGFRVLTIGKLAPGIIVTSLLIWLGYGLFNYILTATFGLSLPFSAAVLVLCTTGLSMIIPSSPGALGVFEAAVVLALSIYGVERSVAFGYGLGLHLFTNITLIVFGLVGLAQEGVSYGQLKTTAIKNKAVPQDSVVQP
jgi:hypothetical protein